MVKCSKIINKCSNFDGYASAIIHHLTTLNSYNTKLLELFTDESMHRNECKLSLR